MVPEFKDFELTWAVVSAGSKSLGQVCRAADAIHEEVRFTSDAETAVKNSDAVIEFAGAEGSTQAAELCARYRRPIVIASTGHTQVQKEKIRASAEQTALLQASNLSLAVFALHRACAAAQAILGPEYEIEIFELHHRHKKDAPSGTALSLATLLASAADLNVQSDRSVRKEPRDARSLGIASLRAGEILGEHTVFFCGAGERLEFTHRTSDRAVFARGGLRVLSSLIGRPAGCYSLADILESNRFIDS